MLLWDKVRAAAHHCHREEHHHPFCCFIFSPGAYRLPPSARPRNLASAGHGLQPAFVPGQAGPPLFGSIAIMADARTTFRTHPPKCLAWRPKPRTQNTPRPCTVTSTWPRGLLDWASPPKESAAQLYRPDAMVFSWGAGCFHRRKALVLAASAAGLGGIIRSDTLAAAAHSRDALSTGAASFSTFVYRFTGWTRLDALMGLAVSAFFGFGLASGAGDPQPPPVRMPVAGSWRTHRADADELPRAGVHDPRQTTTALATSSPRSTAAVARESDPRKAMT